MFFVKADGTLQFIILNHKQNISGDKRYCVLFWPKVRGHVAPLNSVPGRVRCWLSFVRYAAFERVHCSYNVNQPKHWQSLVEMGLPSVFIQAIDRIS